jgi:hypothetical protein
LAAKVTTLALSAGGVDAAEILHQLSSTVIIRLMSEKSVTQKLGLKPGKTLLVQHAPAAIDKMLGVVPDGAKVVETGAGRFPLVLVFAKDRAALIKVAARCKVKLEAGGALWVAYAKGTSSKATDINRDSIHEYVATIGLDTVAQIAIDDDWSALRLKAI